MEVRVPRGHAAGLVAFFGGEGRDRASARASLVGDDLRIEAEGARFVLTLVKEVFVPKELDLSEDRAGDFFGKVVVNLFVTYGGTLRCRVKWDEPAYNESPEGSEVAVEAGRTDWKGDFSIGAWLPDGAVVPLAEGLLEISNPAEEEAPLPDEVQLKLEEARRHFAEYLRLKAAREEVKR